MSAAFEKRKRKAKKGRVVRISPASVALISREQRPDETLTATVDRLFGFGSWAVCYVLPSDLHETIEDARGKAIIEAIRSKIKTVEQPVRVRATK